MKQTSTLVVWTFAATALVFIACSPESAPIGKPLLDDEHAPDVLVESSEIPWRPTLGAQRFVAGWHPRRTGGRVELSASENGAVVEIVRLAPGPRTLAFELAPTSDAATVEVRVADRDLGTIPVADPLRIELPGDLPTGRVAIRLKSLDGTLRVYGARVRPVADGEAQVADGAVEMRGVAHVDLSRRVDAGTLGGSLDGEGELFVETAEGVERFTPDGEFEIPIDEGIVRIRLASSGGEARWSGLELRSPAQEATASTLQEAAAESPPIVVLYVMDALRADFFGEHTPIVQRLSAEGLTFKAHRSVAPNTLPSTKALLTGHAVIDRGGWKLPEGPDEGPPTLAELFAAAGYRTGLFSGNIYVSAAYRVDRGFERAVHRPVEEQADYNDNAARLHADALDWLDEVEDEDRVFLYVHTIHPHNPYAPPSDIREAMTRDIDSEIDGSTATLLDVSRRRRAVGEADQERLRRLYAGALAYNDRELGDFLAAIEERFPNREILLALTSDHGEELFDHGGLLHGYTLYEEMIRIPLILYAPGFLTPGEVDRSTSTLDLHATFVDLLGSEAKSEGRSLLLDAPRRLEPHAAAAASVAGGIFSIQNERWKLIYAPRKGTGWGLGDRLGRTRSVESVYDLRADPQERIDLVGTDDLEIAWLRSRLRAWIAAKTSSDEAEEETTIDPAVRKELEALGYVD